MNVALIIADDWSPIAGCYGDPTIKTPNIDALATRGTVFNQAYCTTPSCAASRANILTGMYSHQHRQYGHSHGFHNFRTWEEAVSLPAILKNAGMKSGLAGKTHIAPPRVYPFTAWHETTSPQYPLFSNSSVTRDVRTCLKEISGTSFYMHCASGYPHRTEENFDKSIHPSEFKDVDIHYEPDTIPVPEYLPDTPGVREDLADYYRFISRFDSFVGDVIQEIDSHGHRDDTMIILLSDHGMPFPGAKASPFEAGHHCPLIIAHPKALGAGQYCDTPVNWTDILPTILHAMDVPDQHHPKNLCGMNLIPLLTSSAGLERELIFDSHTFHGVANYFPYRAARGPKYKYLRCLAPDVRSPMATDLYDSKSYQSILATGGAQCRPMDRLQNHWPEALFDLEIDPQETTNLVDAPELQPIVEEYRAQLTEMRLKTKDPWLEVDFQEGRLSNYR
ncbi:sulfatase family protein [Puniceicoccus vermicola]|uniref:Sulfatase n=1 Tax=Puniceicoccus vermicola TaxID=388746 RepID=A0A7X1B1M6_9BACT|nr:sulfatase [Puniceicoccus vermicola]MBC2603968.1 sulfatase [Puniceicoccus vermicola]